MDVLSPHAQDRSSGVAPVQLSRSGANGPELPERPLVTIEPPAAWELIDLRELWRNRELLYLLTWRDIKVRYKQTVLGVAWVLLQPLMMTLVFSVILGVLARVPSGGVPYPLLVYVGLLPWTFFSAALSASGLSIVGNSHLITKVYFPRLLVPISAVTARLLDFAIGFAILAGMMVYYRVALTVNVLILPIPILLVVVLATGLGIFVSAINVKYRDVGFILPVLIQIWMYVSPVLYSSELIPYKWRRIYALNPLVGIVEGFRSAVLGSTINWFAIGVSTVTSVFFLVTALLIFRRIEKSFADII